MFSARHRRRHLTPLPFLEAKPRSPLSTPEPLPDESPKFRLGGGRVLRIISSMEAPSWEEMLFGGEMLWMVGSE